MKWHKPICCPPLFPPLFLTLRSTWGNSPLVPPSYASVKSVLFFLSYNNFTYPVLSLLFVCVCMHNACACMRADIRVCVCMCDCLSYRPTQVAYMCQCSPSFFCLWDHNVSMAILVIAKFSSHNLHCILRRRRDARAGRRCDGNHGT